MLACFPDYTSLPGELFASEVCKPAKETKETKAGLVDLTETWHCCCQHLTCRLLNQKPHLRRRQVNLGWKPDTCMCTAWQAKAEKPAKAKAAVL